jgi:hypothetical protein
MWKKTFPTHDEAIAFCAAAEQQLKIWTTFLGNVIPLAIARNANAARPELATRFEAITGPVSTACKIHIQPQLGGEEDNAMAVDVARWASGWGYRTILEAPPQRHAAADPAKKKSRSKKPAAKSAAAVEVDHG